jgi:predicted dehydrogenase
VLWVTGEKWPRKVFSTGGRPIKGAPVNDASGQTTDTPDHQVAAYEFEQFTMTWEHRQFAGNETDKGENVGVYFYGTEGIFHMGWQKGWTFYPAKRGAQPVHAEPQLGQPDAQNIKELWADFLDAIQTGRRPVSDIEEVHRSTNCALLGMLSLKLGRSVSWDGAKELCPGDDAANKLLRRAYRAPWVYPAS